MQRLTLKNRIVLALVLVIVVALLGLLSIFGVPILISSNIRWAVISFFSMLAAFRLMAMRNKQKSERS